MVRQAERIDHTGKGLEEALYRYFENAQLSAELRDDDVPCPPPAIRLILADRWHVVPWSFDDAPADDFLYWLNVLGIEAEAHADREGLSPDETSTRMG